MKGFVREKIRVELFRGFSATTRRNLSRTNLELRHDDLAGETSLPEGEIVAIVDMSILHHAFMLILSLYGLLLYFVEPYLCLFSLNLQGLFEEGEYRQLEF